jgi:hypothetical protein
LCGQSAPDNISIIDPQIRLRIPTAIWFMLTGDE